MILLTPNECTNNLFARSKYWLITKMVSGKSALDIFGKLLQNCVNLFFNSTCRVKSGYVTAFIDVSQVNKNVVHKCKVNNDLI